MIAREWQSVQRLLVIRLDNLGDVILISPAVASIARALPNAQITLLASPVGAQAGELHPDIDEVIVYEAPWVDPWQRIPQDSDREQTVISRLHEKAFDAAVIFTSYRQSSLPAAYLCYLAGIPLRLGICHDASGSLLTTRHRPVLEDQHEVERGLELIGTVGIPSLCRDIALTIPDPARTAVKTWLVRQAEHPRSGPLIVVHPGCSMPSRTYPWERFTDVITLLVQKLDAMVVVTGTEPERPLVARILDRLPPGVRETVYPLVGSRHVSHLAALIDEADLVVTNNTGPMHVAAAVGTPSVILFALTNPPHQWQPWKSPHRLLYADVPCRICYSRTCPLGHHGCLTGVEPDAVVAAAHELLPETALPLAFTRAQR